MLLRIVTQQWWRQSVVTAKRDQILRMLKKTRVLRPQDVEAVGISRTYLNKLHAQGVLDRPSRGLYILQDDDRHRLRRWLGQVSGRARRLLFTYRAEVRIDGELLIINLQENRLI